MIMADPNFWEGFQEGMALLFRPPHEVTLPEMPAIRSPEEIVAQAWGTAGKHLREAIRSTEDELAHK